MFDEISNPKRVEALRDAIDAFQQHGFQWNDQYVATVEPGHRVELTMAGGSGLHFMARTNSQILIGNVSDLPAPQPRRGEQFTLIPSEHTWGGRR
jgi:hypothetical protein